MPLPVPLDIATAIASRLGAPYVLGTNVFEGPVRAAKNGIPAEAIFVVPYAGALPQLQRGVATPTEIRQHRLQVRVRSDQEDYAGGQSLARDVLSEMSHNPPAGYHDVRPLQPHPIYLRKDEQGLHEFAVNFEVWAEETI